jgi:hypothetical protein
MKKLKMITQRQKNKKGLPQQPFNILIQLSGLQSRRNLNSTF